MEDSEHLKILEEKLYNSLLKQTTAHANKQTNEM